MNHSLSATFMRYLCRFFSLCCACCCFCWQTANATDWLEVKVDAPQQWQQLRSLVSDLTAPQQGIVNVYASPQEHLALLSAGFEVHLKTPDVEQYYAQRAQSARRESLSGSMGGFRTFAEIEAELDRLHDAYPQLVSEKFALGYSLEGHPLWAVRLSDNPEQHEADEPVFWLDGLHHAREPISGETVLRFAQGLLSQYAQNPDIAYLLHTRQILLVPCVNPDGYLYNQQLAPDGGGFWRKNRRRNEDGSVGVDLNRNYDWFWGKASAGVYEQGSSSRYSDTDYRGSSAFSEPETQAIRNAMETFSPAIAMTLHGYGQEWMYPWGYTSSPAPDVERLQHYAQLMAHELFRVGNAWELYGITNGAADDYFYGKHQILSYTVEIGTAQDGFWPAPERVLPLFEQVRPGLEQAVQYSGAWADISVFDWQEQQGNGDQWLDSGEQWQLQITLENQGISPLNTELQIADCLPLRSHCALHTRSIEILPQQQQTLEPFLIYIETFSHYKPQLNILLSHANEHRLFKPTLPLNQEQAALPEAPLTPVLRISEPPQAGKSLTVSVHSEPHNMIYLFAAWNAATTPYSLPNVEGDVGLIDPLLIWQMQADATGTAQWQVMIPADGSWQGQKIFLQALSEDEVHLQTSQMQPLLF